MEHQGGHSDWSRMTWRIVRRCVLRERAGLAAESRLYRNTHTHPRTTHTHTPEPRRLLSSWFVPSSTLYWQSSASHCTGDNAQSRAHCLRAGTGVSLGCRDNTLKTGTASLGKSWPGQEGALEQKRRSLVLGKTDPSLELHCAQSLARSSPGAHWPWQEYSGTLKV